MALLPYFKIGAARQRHSHPDQQVFGPDSRYRHSFDFEIFAAVQHGRHHVSVGLCNHGKTTTLREFSVGREAMVKAFSISSSGKR